MYVCVCDSNIDLKETYFTCYHCDYKVEKISTYMSKTAILDMHENKVIIIIISNLVNLSLHKNER